MRSRAVVVGLLCAWPVAAEAGFAGGRPICDPAYPPPVHGADIGGSARVAGKTLFLNFDGGEMQWCGTQVDDPVDNCSTIFQGLVVPYRGELVDRLAVVQAVRADLEPYDIMVTDRRPDRGASYDMEMIGNWLPAHGGGFAGIAPKIDCFDSAGGDVSFTLDFSDYPSDIAKVVLQEVAHTWGLEHVDSPADLLFPHTGGSPDPYFTDGCHPITYAMPYCTTQHEMYCPAGEQNAHAEILALFGAAMPDTTAPVVTIVSPTDGAIVPPTVYLVLEIDDDIAPQGFATTIDVEGLGSVDNVFGGPGVVPILLQALAPGETTILVKVADEAGNEAITSATVTVRGPAAETDSDDGAADSDDASDGTGDDATMTGDTGCGCRIPAMSAADVRWAWGVPFLAFTRRRRRAPATAPAQVGP